MVAPAGPLRRGAAAPAAGPSPREISAQNAFQFAVSYAKDHSAELDEQAKLFEKIVADYDKTPACADAKRGIAPAMRSPMTSAMPDFPTRTCRGVTR